MKCVMSHGVYLRADGRLPCYCGSGETVTLGQVPIEGGGSFDFMQDFYTQGLFKKIRDAQAKDMVPFPGICDQCTYLDLDQDYDPASDSTLDWFHWEPSSHCMLDCQWCTVEKLNLRQNGHTRHLSLEVFKEIVSNMAQNGLRLNKGNICGVGEPTVNPKVWDMVKFTKDHLGGDILISTNGNGRYSDKIVSSGLDKIKIAVDAVNQELYQQYRKRGKLEKVLKFTKAIADEKERQNSDKPLIIWQYILFNHNDSDKDLIEFQKMAEENGVNQLRIVYTRCTNYSPRTPEDFPSIFPNIIFFPIGPNSRLDIAKVNQDWSQIQTLTASGDLNQAATETIRLVNSIYHRLALGIETYDDLLTFAKGLHHCTSTDSLDLSEQDFAEFSTFIRKCFSTLEKIYAEKGENEQSLSYRNFRLKNLFSVA